MSDDGESVVNTSAPNTPKINEEFDWLSAPPPPGPPMSLRTALRMVRRGSAVVLLISFGVIVQQLLRPIELIFFRPKRPWTPWITQIVARACLFVIGFSYRRSGNKMAEPGAFVANHIGWLDIFTLNAAGRFYFVSKADVSGWPGIGWLARSVGTVFIERRRNAAKTQAELFAKIMRDGGRLLFFPEGTSTDGLRVLPFKTSLFESFLQKDLRAHLSVQPISVSYHAAPGEDPKIYGWWSDMSFAEHLLRVLALPRQGRIEVVYHTPIAVSQISDRKALALECELAVRAGHNLGALPNTR